ncbi:hypothetical protein [Actinoplanes regularis]|uniref:Uncharacterized protein n=1 Tax=Actinoplanes regularis TaxID=52697 RepID=A0A238WRE6_9ACTN|nr:hypothetical protein [Actinoplanes regularis]GIE84580.1 hypothetical protein Are01nite_10600 [Actinoplanes regularis]SNR49092.1 hypothetical protein SAMN06264365_102832 [Actinoplanes regularis]
MLTWHKDGRPAEEPADPTGQTFTRDDLDVADDPRPVSPARPPARIGDAESHISTDGHRENDETPQPTATRPLIELVSESR